MSPRLRAMFALIATLTVGGTVYYAANLKPEFATADAVDAGLLKVSTTLRLSCRMRVTPSCRGVGPAYGKYGLRAQLVTGTDPDVVLFNLPLDDAGTPCYRLIGTPQEACDVIENGSCTAGAAICGANAVPQLETQLCACRQPDAGNCRVPTLPDAGGLVQAPLGVTIQPPFIGPGCTPKFCGPVVAGEQGADWPAECPQ